MALHQYLLGIATGDFNFDKSEKKKKNVQIFFNIFEQFLGVGKRKTLVNFQWNTQAKTFSIELPPPHPSHSFLKAEKQKTLTWLNLFM